MTVSRKHANDDGKLYVNSAYSGMDPHLFTARFHVPHERGRSYEFVPGLTVPISLSVDARDPHEATFMFTITDPHETDMNLDRKAFLIKKVRSDGTADLVRVSEPLERGVAESHTFDPDDVIRFRDEIARPGNEIAEQAFRALFREFHGRGFVPYAEAGYGHEHYRRFQRFIDACESHVRSGPADLHTVFDFGHHTGKILPGPGGRSLPGGRRPGLPPPHPHRK